MTKVALVIAEKMFRDEEYQVPKEVLTKAGFEVLTVSTTKQEAQGKLGLKVVPDTLLKEIQIDTLDALVFIGGGGAEQYFDDPLAHQLAKEARAKGKVVGAICIAPVILANAGLLKGKKATVYPDGGEILASQGALYTKQPVEVDGKIITGNGPEAAQAFGEALVRLLS